MRLSLSMQRIRKPVAKRVLCSRPADSRSPWNKQRQVAIWFALFAFALSVKAWSQITSVLTPNEVPKGQSSHLQAIAHVTVIDPGSGGDEQRDMTILFRDSMIIAVERSAEARIPSGTEIHDEHGRYVMPGLWDTHVHLTQVGPKAFPLFLANGITSVRDMGSDLIEIRQWQEARSQGALIPRILTPGPKLDGMTYGESLHAEYRPDRFVVTSPETARAIVDVLLKSHVDFIKVHNGNDVRHLRCDC